MIATLYRVLASEEERDRWVDEVTSLYVSDVDMESDEFERLLALAMKGLRPNHPRLPAYLPVEGMEMEGEWR